MSSPVGVVAAVSPDGVIGRDNRIPWRRPADLRRFKALTLGARVVMGRRTFESIGRPLPGRDNWVVTSRPAIEGVSVAPDLATALGEAEGPVFVIGGARLFAEAMAGPADFVDLTFVPDRVPVEGSVLMPPLDPHRWAAGRLVRNPEDPNLWHRRYHRWTR